MCSQCPSRSLCQGRAECNVVELVELVTMNQYIVESDEENDDDLQSQEEFEDQYNHLMT